MDNTNFNASQFNEIATQISTTKSEIETSLNSIMSDFSSDFSEKNGKKICLPEFMGYTITKAHSKSKKELLT